MAIFDQAEFEVRFEWGLPGLQVLAPTVDVVVIVDVLSFTTCVSIAVDRGATIFPYEFDDRSAANFAQGIGAHLAVARKRMSSEHPYSLSPASMMDVTKGTRIVLPSPNGSALSYAARDATNVVLAGCLRNANAVARAVAGRTVAVIAAGERWKQGGTLRPAAEDLLGAGAIIRELPGSKSPEALAAVALFESVRERMPGFLILTTSGKELQALGFEADVGLASELNVTSTVPVMREKAFVPLNDQS